MFTLREIFYNEKLRVCRRAAIQARAGEINGLRPKTCAERPKHVQRGLNTLNIGAPSEPKKVVGGIGSDLIGLGIPNITTSDSR
jgi:hypothetical protein